MTKIMKEQKELFIEQIRFYEKEIVANIEKLETSGIGSVSRNLRHEIILFSNYYTGAVFLAHKLLILSDRERDAFLFGVDSLRDKSFDIYLKKCC